MDVHPIRDRPTWPIEDRVVYLEMYLAQLWDQVWWVSLPFYRRWYYICQGFRCPIRHFYN